MDWEIEQIWAAASNASKARAKEQEGVSELILLPCEREKNKRLPKPGGACSIAVFLETAATKAGYSDESLSLSSSWREVFASS
jgi:hypothetical protein